MNQRIPVLPNEVRVPQGVRIYAAARADAIEEGQGRRFGAAAHPSRGLPEVAERRLEFSVDADHEGSLQVPPAALQVGRLEIALQEEAGDLVHYQPEFLDRQGRNPVFGFYGANPAENLLPSHRDRTRRRVRSTKVASLHAMGQSMCDSVRTIHSRP